MKILITILLCISIPCVSVGEPVSYKVTYDGGSLPDVKAGVGMKLYVEANQIRLEKDKADVIFHRPRLPRLVTVKMFTGALGLRLVWL